MFIRSIKTIGALRTIQTFEGGLYLIAIENLIESEEQLNFDLMIIIVTRSKIAHNVMQGT
jgi:hypothetical protein